MQVAQLLQPIAQKTFDNQALLFVPWEAIISKAPLMVYSAYSLEGHVTSREISRYIPAARDVSRYFPGSHMTPRGKNTNASM